MSEPTTAAEALAEAFIATVYRDRKTAEAAASIVLRALPPGWFLTRYTDAPRPWGADTWNNEDYAPSGPPRPANRPMRGCPACTDRERAE